jgi:hypothetical protein
MLHVLNRAIRAVDWDNGSTGWVNPSRLHSKMCVLDSSFNYKDGGFKKFSDFLKVSALFNFREGMEISLKVDGDPGDALVKLAPETAQSKKEEGVRD